MFTYIHIRYIYWGTIPPVDFTSHLTFSSKMCWFFLLLSFFFFSPQTFHIYQRRMCVRLYHWHMIFHPSLLRKIVLLSVCLLCTIPCSIVFIINDIYIVRAGKSSMHSMAEDKKKNVSQSRETNNIHWKKETTNNVYDVKHYFFFSLSNERLFIAVALYIVA